MKKLSLLTVFAFAITGFYCVVFCIAIITLSVVVGGWGNATLFWLCVCVLAWALHRVGRYFDGGEKSGVPCTKT